MGRSKRYSAEFKKQTLHRPKKIAIQAIVSRSTLTRYAVAGLAGVVVTFALLMQQ